MCFFLNPSKCLNTPFHISVISYECAIKSVPLHICKMCNGTISFTTSCKCKNSLLCFQLAHFLFFLFNLCNFKANRNCKCYSTPLQTFSSWTYAAEFAKATTHGGKPTVLLFTFHQHSPLSHGCYPSEQSTNQLWECMGPVWTVCLLLAVLVSTLGKRGLNQVLISRTDCLFFHYLCPSDEHGWALTHDPFH